MAFYSKKSANLKALEQENDKLRRAVEELSVLNELSREIGVAHDTETIINKIVKSSLRAVKAEQGVINLVDEEDPEPLKTFIRTTSSSGEHESLRLNESLLGWMYLYKQPLVINDPHTDERFRHTPWTASVRSVLCVPLIVRTKLTGILTVFNKKDGDGFSESDQRLLAIIAAQSAQVIENARLLEEEKNLMRMQEEVRLAYNIQTNLLPTKTPEIPGYDLTGVSIPAQVVGGDYFDFIPRTDQQVGFCVGDVVGKGLPASLLMANVQATLRGQALWADSVRQCLERSNRLLYESTSAGAFVTLFYGVLDATQHVFRYANAGHNRPLHWKPGQIPTTLESSGLVLAALANTTYKEFTLSLQPQELVLIYSDGVTEAMNARREEYSEEKLAEVVGQYGHEPVQTLIQRIVSSVKEHAGGAPQTDDITLLAFKRLR